MSRYIKSFGTVTAAIFLFIMQAQPTFAASQEIAPALGGEPVMQGWSDWGDWGDGIDTFGDWGDWGDGAGTFGTDWGDW